MTTAFTLYLHFYLFVCLFIRINQLLCVLPHFLSCTWSLLSNECSRFFRVYSLFPKRKISIPPQYLFRVPSYWLTVVVVAKKQKNPEFSYSDQTSSQFNHSLSFLFRILLVYFLPFLLLISSSCFWFERKKNINDIFKVDASPWSYCTMKAFPGLWNNLPVNLK